VNVSAYREARAVHDKRKAGASDVSTETIRIALNGYDDLFQDLLATHRGPAEETPAVDAATHDTPALETSTDDTPTHHTDIPTDETSTRRHEAEAAS
jgi:hypothetical protein